LGNSNTNSGIYSSSKLNLDGTELYGEDGQTIVDIAELGTIEILEILDIKKDCKSSQK
jgi:hypothetical protein